MNSNEHLLLLCVVRYLMPHAGFISDIGLYHRKMGLSFRLLGINKHGRPQISASAVGRQ
jgi:hypothetical protein